MTINNDNRTTEDIMPESSQAHVIRGGQCTTWFALAAVTTQTYDGWDNMRYLRGYSKV